MLVRHSAPCGAWIARHERESSQSLISRHRHAHLLSSSWHSFLLCWEGGVQGNSTRLANFDRNDFLGLDLTGKGAEGRYDLALHFPFGQSFCQIPHSADSRGGDLLD